MGVLTIIGVICLAGAVAVLVPAVILAVEVFAAGRAAPSRMRQDGDGLLAPSSLVVLVPAHNEASGITETIGHIRHALAGGGRILVVADNCTDKTAQLAAAAGAEIVERSDPVLRGKGYALAHGVRALAHAPPDVVVIVDADCAPQERSIARVAALAHAKQRPVQGLYLLDPPGGELSPHMKVALIAWRLKNLARPLGLLTLGLPCHLVGTGMALPWRVLEQVDLHTGHLTEDVALGLDCAALRRAPIFCPQALFLSQFPTNVEAQGTQRARWETGHVSIITKAVPALLARAVKERNRDLLVLALDIAVPPLALLALGMTASLTAAAVLALAGGWTSPLLLSATALGLLVLSVIWARDLVIKDTMSIFDLLLAPAYVVAKIMLYFRIMMGRNLEWVRTRRD